MSNSLQPQGLYPAKFLCPWNLPGKDTEVGSHSLLQGIFPSQGSNLGLQHCGFFTVWTTGKSQESGNRLPFPPPRDIPEPGIKPMSPVFPTLQESSLPLSHLGSPFNAWLVPKQQKVFIFVLWEASKSTTLQSKVFPQQSRGLTLEESKTLIFDFRLC